MRAAPSDRRAALSPPRIDVRAVRRTFAGEGRAVRALDGVSFEVAASEIVALLGPSGSGKSTLLRIAAGLDRPDAGEVRFDGRPVEGPGHAGYMPQRDLLLPWRRVLGNLTLGPEIAGVPRAEAEARARAELGRFGLEGFEDAWPSELSGGMRQRAALLRTVLAGRGTLLLDEPFGALDALTRLELQDWLLGAWQASGWTLLVVTHDVEEAVYLADRVVALTPRPGRVALDLPVELPRPRAQAMRAEPAFGRHVAPLLAALGVR